MNRFQLLLVGAVVLGLTACGDPQASAPEAPTAKASSPAESLASGFTALQGVTEKTAAAVKSDKFDQAKTEFEKFEASWKTVEDGVKAKSSDTYNKIEEGLDAVNGELKNKLPDKAKVTTALQTLSQEIAAAAKL
jgi:outer membrane murein-binding lipoprotein Lpp